MSKANKGGRPPQYAQWLEPDKLKLLEQWASDGLSIAEIAKCKIGISERTFYQWQSDHYQIAQAIKKGRTFCVLEVENALYKAAVGYEDEEIITETITTKAGTITKRRVQKRFVPPNIAAVIFYLKNRAPKSWRPDSKLTIERGDESISAPLVINYGYVSPRTIESIDEHEPSKIKLVAHTGEE